MTRILHIALSLLVFTSVASAVESYYELRIYTVTSNKLDGVLERFRDTVDPVRRKLGITTIGYWSALGTTNGGTFAYLMAAASKEELQRQEKEFGADPQFKEGYAASNKKHGKTVDKIVALALAADATAKLDFTPAKTRARSTCAFTPCCPANSTPFAIAGAISPCRSTNATACTVSAGGSRRKRMPTGMINSSACWRAKAFRRF